MRMPDSNDMADYCTSLFAGRILPLFVAAATVVGVCLLATGCESSDDEDSDDQTEETTTSGADIAPADGSDTTVGGGSVNNTTLSAEGLVEYYTPLTTYDTPTNPPQGDSSSDPDDEADIQIDGG